MVKNCATSINTRERSCSVGDKKESISSINVNAEFALDDPIVAFWTDDQAYADFLTATFEVAWNEAVDAEKRVREL